MGRGPRHASSPRRSASTLTDAHWKAIRFLREDYAEHRARPRRCAGCPAVGGIPIKELFALFPEKPAKKMAYIAGLPKPHGCV